MSESKVTKISGGLSLREQAEAEVALELMSKNKEAMKKLLRERAAAEQVLRGVEMQIADLEQRIKDGTA